MRRQGNISSPGAGEGETEQRGVEDKDSNGNSQTAPRGVTGVMSLFLRPHECWTGRAKDIPNYLGGEWGSCGIVVNELWSQGT